MAGELHAVVNIRELRTHGWAIVELMGHTTVAGRVDEAMLGDSVGLRVISPVGEDEEWVATYATSAIYGVTICTEEVARLAARENTPPLYARYVEYPKFQGERMQRAREEAERVKADIDEALRRFPPDDLPF